jgi:hypothetical protein
MRTVLTIDHQDYLNERRYRRQVHAALRRLSGKQPGRLYDVNVAHERDGSCCAREPWLTTWARIIESLGEDGCDQVGVIFGGRMLQVSTDDLPAVLRAAAEMLDERVRR